MRLSGLFLLLLTAASAHAAPSSIKQCNDAREPVAGMPWLPNGAKSNACHQMVGGSPQYQAFDGMPAGKIIAFNNGVITGIKEDRKELLPGDTMMFSESDWIEHASTAPAGELWWGRTPRWHVFAGQESHERLRQAVTQLPVKEQMDMARWYQARMMATLTKTPMPSQPGDEKFTLFRNKKSASYHQRGATTATFEGGLGGDGEIAPGRIESAKLSVQIGSVLSGVLTFDMKVDGVIRSFTIPVASEGEPFRLHAAVGSGGNVLCKRRAGRKPSDPEDCILTPGDRHWPAELYDGKGAFFGDHAALAAFKVQFKLNVRQRNRRESFSTGVIILERDPV